MITANIISLDLCIVTPTDASQLNDPSLKTLFTQINNNTSDKGAHSLMKKEAKPHKS